MYLGNAGNRSGDSGMENKLTNCKQGPLKHLCAMERTLWFNQVFVCVDKERICETHTMTLKYMFLFLFILTFNIGINDC